MGDVLRSLALASSEGATDSMTSLPRVGSPASFPSVMLLALLGAYCIGTVELTAANVAALSQVEGGRDS